MALVLENQVEKPWSAHLDELCFAAAMGRIVLGGTTYPKDDLFFQIFKFERSCVLDIFRANQFSEFADAKLFRVGVATHQSVFEHP